MNVFLLKYFDQSIILKERLRCGPMKQFVWILGTYLTASCMIAGDAILGAGAEPRNESPTVPQSGPAQQQEPLQPDSPVTEAEQSVAAIQLSTGRNLVLNAGEQVQLTGHVHYRDDTRDSALSWSSADQSIATVNSTTGMVSAVKPGVTTLIATAVKDTHQQSQITVTVRPPDVVAALTHISPSQASLRPGETLQFQARIQLSDGSFSPNVTWRSANQRIAVVTAGLVTAVGPGETEITALAASDTGKTATAQLIVTD